jgi:hypothetical protein
MRHLPPVAPSADPNLPMRGPFAKSFIAHCAVFLAINILAWANSRSVQRQADAFVDHIAKQERRDIERARKSERAAAAEIARSRLEMEVADLVSAAGRTPEGDQLIADASATLSDLFNDDAAADASEADFEQMRLAALDRVQADADRQLKEMLIAQVRQYVRDEVAPELRERIDKQLKDQAGVELQKTVSGGVREERDDRRRIAAELRKRAAELAHAGDDLRQAQAAIEHGDAQAAGSLAARSRDTVRVTEAEAHKAVEAAVAQGYRVPEAMP